jgi:hypothetical protein
MCRQASKRTEEKAYGLDLALLMKCKVRDSLDFETSQLIQVKKPQRGGDGGSFVNIWSIDAGQLATLLSVSGSACYWLFDARGAVLAVPAKILMGLMGARELKPATFRVSYYEIRASAIPLAQFLVDLFVGGWVGDSSTRNLQIARGEDPLIIPRLMAGLEIEWRQTDEPQF